MGYLRLCFVVDSVSCGGRGGMKVTQIERLRDAYDSFKWYATSNQAMRLRSTPQVHWKFPGINEASLC